MESFRTGFGSGRAIRACSGVAVSYAASGLGSFPILLFGSEEQKARYMPDIASGKRLAAFALTKPTLAVM